MDAEISINTLMPHSRPKRFTQYIAAISASIGAFGMGTAMSWTSPAGSYLGKRFDESTVSWIASAMPLGAALIVLPCGWSMDRFGRKNTMLALAPPFVAGWLLVLFADPIWMFILGRLITGMMGGAFSLTAPAYTSEIADNGVRGMLGSFFQLMVTFGILFDYVLGAARASYNLLTGLCAAVPVCFALIFFFMPETPIQLLKKGSEEQAYHSLQWFRGRDYDIEKEIQEQKNSVNKIQKEEISFTQAFKSRAAKKGMLIAMGLMMFQQLSGINAVIFFAEDIFEDAGSGIDSSVAPVFIGVVQVISTFVSTQVVDRLGRRILLLLSDSVMCICSVLLGLYFYLQEQGAADNIGWLPLASLCIFNVVFSLGFGPIPWMMVGELFPPSIKGAASSIACMFNWILAFLVTKFFSDLKTLMGTGPAFWLFAAVSAIGTVFVLLIVPETKGKSLQQIQAELGGEIVDDDDVSSLPEKF